MKRSSPTVEDLPPAQREALDAVLSEANGGLDAADRAFVGDYVLGRQSPGQAEGTWRLLQSSPDAARWAERVRDALTDAGLEDPPPLPSDEGALSPTERARIAANGDTAQTLGDRREERSRARTAASAQQAAAEIASPFRSEAIAAHQEADDRIELPRWAPRPAQLAMYGVLAALVVGLAFSIFVRIPVNTNALVLITDVPAGSPGSRDGGLQILAFFPQGNGHSKDTGSGQDVHVGDVVRVALPGEDSRTPMRLRWVSDGPQAPRSVIDGYHLPVGQANVVVAPGYVALAPLDVPPGKRPRSYEGTTTLEASVQTGSRRIISLLF